MSAGIRVSDVKMDDDDKQEETEKVITMHGKNVQYPRWMMGELIIATEGKKYLWHFSRW